MAKWPLLTFKAQSVKQSQIWYDNEMGVPRSRNKKGFKNNIAGGRSGGFNAKFMRFPTPFVFLPPWCERSLGFVTWGSSRRSLWSVPFQVCRPMSSFVSNKFKSNGYWERIINFAFVNSTFFNFSNWVPFDGENLKEKQAEKDLNSLKNIGGGVKKMERKRQRAMFEAGHPVDKATKNGEISHNSWLSSLFFHIQAIVTIH